MIAYILEELMNAVPYREVASDNLTREWESISQYFASKLCEFGNATISTIKPIFGKNFSDQSVAECLVEGDAGVSIAEYRLRPKTKYYLDLNKDIPLPENPKGPHATGLKLSLSLLTSLKSREIIIPAKIVMQFEVWGDSERQGFGKMLKDYKRPIAKLMCNRGYDFFTSVPFDNIDKYKGNDILRKLSLYYQNEYDDENMFSISKEFTVNNEMSNVVDAIIPLATLYDCSMGYSQLRKNRDRMFKFLNVIENIK